MVWNVFHEVNTSNTAYLRDKEDDGIVINEA